MGLAACARERLWSTVNSVRPSSCSAVLGTRVGLRIHNTKVVFASVCMYVYIYIYILTYIHIYIYIYMYRERDISICLYSWFKESGSRRAKRTDARRKHCRALRECLGQAQNRP